MINIPISEPTGSAPSAPQWRAFLEMGFRPLYLAGGFWALVSIALWVYLPQHLSGLLPGLYWHAHEMLWGFVATIAVGFLFTAVSNWTGVNPLHGKPLGGITLLWVAARACYLLPGVATFWIGFAAETAFFALAAVALGKAVYASPTSRNYGVPILVGMLGLLNALYLLAAWQGRFEQIMQIYNAGLIIMALIAVLISRRVIPFFASRAIAGLDIPMLAASGRWQLGAGALAIILILLDQRSAAGVALAAVGVIAVAQIIAWKPWAVLRKPILWILYLGYTSLGIGLIVAALQFLGVSSLRAAWSVHIIGVAGFSVLIIGMITRTALGHLGRMLQTDRSMVLSYLLIITAAVLRLIALLPGEHVQACLHASAGAWVLGFALYLWRFTPWMIRPRM